MWASWAKGWEDGGLLLAKVAVEVLVQLVFVQRMWWWELAVVQTEQKKVWAGLVPR
jgi:hypothetical protein